MGKLIQSDMQGDRLILRVNENIASANADLLLREAEACLTENAHAGIEFDFSKVEYISSAGLRTLLSLYNKEKNQGATGDFFRVTGVCPTVWEILEMTGFTTIFSVSRAMRKISLENATLIGDGFFSKVYRVDAENIVKVYNANASEADVQRELARAKYALILGVPTAISYDIVDVDGCRGVLFEMMNCGSLRDAFRDQPEQAEHLISQYATLLRTLHATVDTDRQLPEAKQGVTDKLASLTTLLSAEESARIARLFDTLPESDTILHGDCHIKNIMLHNGEPLLIDLDTLSRGDPVIELGNLYFTYTAFETLWPGNTEEFIGISAAQAFSIRDGLLRAYFAGVSPAEYEADLDRIRFICWFRMLCFMNEFKRDDAENTARVLGFLRDAMDRISDLKLTFGHAE